MLVSAIDYYNASAAPPPRLLPNEWIKLKCGLGEIIRDPSLLWEYI